MAYNIHHALRSEWGRHLSAALDRIENDHPESVRWLDESWREAAVFFDEDLGFEILAPGIAIGNYRHWMLTTATTREILFARLAESVDRCRYEGALDCEIGLTLFTELLCSDSYHYWTRERGYDADEYLELVAPEYRDKVPWWG